MNKECGGTTTRGSIHISRAVFNWGPKFETGQTDKDNGLQSYRIRHRVGLRGGREEWHPGDRRQQQARPAVTARELVQCWEYCEFIEVNE